MARMYACASGDQTSWSASSASSPYSEQQTCPGHGGFDDADEDTLRQLIDDRLPGSVAGVRTPVRDRS